MLLVFVGGAEFCPHRAHSDELHRLLPATSHQEHGLCPSADAGVECDIPSDECRLDEGHHHDFRANSGVRWSAVHALGLSHGGLAAIVTPSSLSAMPLPPASFCRGGATTAFPTVQLLI